MKKTIVILLAAVTVLMGGLASVYAGDNAAEDIFKVDIKNICTICQLPADIMPFQINKYVA